MIELEGLIVIKQETKESDWLVLLVKNVNSILREIVCMERKSLHGSAYTNSLEDAYRCFLQTKVDSFC